VNFSKVKFDYLFVDEGDFAILDATNTTVSRRKKIKKLVQDKIHVAYKTIWIESICNLKEVIEDNIVRTKITSPDYKDWDDHEKAADDFRNRIKEYEKVYETLSDELDGDEEVFIKLINHGSKIAMRNLRGYLESKILSYLINLHTGERPIYFTRHGESEFNTKNLIGGDSSLSELGEKFSDCLADFFRAEMQSWGEVKDDPLVYCSTLKRTIQTSNKLAYINNPSQMKYLDEIDAGLMDGMSYDDVKKTYPVDFEERNKNKLFYRYPRGESYMDVIYRIEPMIFELERRKGPVIIVGHQGMIRCLYGYFACVPIEYIPTLEIPIHTVIKFVPQAYGFLEERYIIDPLTGSITKDTEKIKKFPDQLSHQPK
jgi:broad specificity phosphatase PhoE